MRLSLRSSLAALSALSFLMAAGLGVVALKSLDVVNGGAQTLYGDILPRISDANAMSIAFGDLRIAEAEHASSSSEPAKRSAEAAISGAMAAFTTSLEKYRNALAPDAAEQRQILDAIGAAIDAYVALDATFVDYSSTYREIDAGALFNADMKASYTALNAMLAELIAISGRAADATDARNDATFDSSWLMLLALVVGSLAVSVASATFGFVGVSRPMGRLRDVMVRVAQGDLAAEVPFAARGHEIGAMASAVQVFKDGLLHARELEAETATARAGAEAQRQAATRDLAERFENAVGGIIATVSAASTELQATAEQMTGAAGQTASQSSAVAAAATDAATNVSAVAAATEQLGMSVQEIARQVGGSVRLAQATVDDADRTGRLVRALSEAASEIGDVVEIISSIAGQTNLLALNATIEAARAGEAGRGFAVVATEVKALAAQTAKATDEISRQIAGIQSTTADAVEAIGAIGARIREMSDTAGAIASSVDQQGEATQEIVRNVSRAASRTSEVTTNVAGVAAAADETGVAAAHVLRSASELSRQSEHLGSEVGRFLTTVRAA